MTPRVVKKRYAWDAGPVRVPVYLGEMKAGNDTVLGARWMADAMKRCSIFDYSERSGRRRCVIYNSSQAVRALNVERPEFRLDRQSCPLSAPGDLFPHY